MSKNVTARKEVSNIDKSKIYSPRFIVSRAYAAYDTSVLGYEVSPICVMDGLQLQYRQFSNSEWKDIAYARSNVYPFMDDSKLKDIPVRK